MEVTNTADNQWEPFRYSASDGLPLAGRKYGWQHLDRAPVVMLAGLTRNSADFHELATFLATHPKAPRRVLALDYRGRGMSGHDSNWKNYNPLTEADDVLSGMVAAGLDHVHVIGTSRGGMIAMILGAMRPGILKSVILNDVGPEIDGPGLVRIRQYVENSKMPSSMDEAARFLEYAGKQQFPGWNHDDWLGQAENIFEEKDGKLIHRYDRALVNTLKSIDLDAPLPTMWPQYTSLRNLPVMAIRGENTDLLSVATFKKMKETIPHLVQVTVQGEGHAPDVGHGELPNQISSFLVMAEGGKISIGSKSV